MDQGSLCIAQLEVGKRLVWVVDEALQIFGGYGYIAEQDIEHFYRDAWAILAELGTEEELKDTVIEKILGKQR
jgi:alkylation response protein AidB-like acyl-CoA dehydrogenase